MTIIFTYHHTNIGRESSRKWKRGGGLDRPKSLFKKGSALGRFCHLTAHNDVLRFENADPVCSRVKLLLSLTSRIKKNCHRVDTNVFYRMLMGSRDKTRQRSLASLASLSVDNVLPHVPVLDMSAIASPVPQLLWITQCRYICTHGLEGRTTLSSFHFPYSHTHFVRKLTLMNFYG